MAGAGMFTTLDFSAGPSALAVPPVAVEGGALAGADPAIELQVQLNDARQQIVLLESELELVQ
jgi:hypothetical protein